MRLRDMGAGESSDGSGSPRPPNTDDGLRRILKWVFLVLVLTVLFALLVVELTIRWFA
jgi:hypothetical protein